MTTDSADAFASADLVLVGPVAPLRGGIAQHTERLAEAVVASGRSVAIASFERLYPASLFPGRSQRTSAAAPPCSREVLDVLSPPTWLALGRSLESGRATVVLQWWHPLVAPAYAAAVRRIPRERLVAVCHNVLPHEPVPAAAAVARRVLSRCGRLVCHSDAEAERAREVCRFGSDEMTSVPLPCLLSEGALSTEGGAPLEMQGFGPGARVYVAAGHLRPYKGAALLARAWAAARRPSNARLVFVGESYLSAAEAGELHAAAGRDPSIVFVDRYVEDEELVRFLASAEAVVAAHLDASQSGVVPIARTLGVPLIVSDAGSLAAQASAGGAEAVVVAAGDEAALARAIEEALAAPPQPRRPAGSASSRAAEWRAVVEAIVGAARP